MLNFESVVTGSVVDVTFKKVNTGNLVILYNNIKVAFIHKISGSIITTLLDFNEIESLRSLGVAICDRAVNT